jgi:hypothetical protein
LLEGLGENAMKVSRRVAQLGLGAAILLLIASMAIVFVGSTQGKQQLPTDNAQPAALTVHPGQ